MAGRRALENGRMFRERPKSTADGCQTESTERVHVSVNTAIVRESGPLRRHTAIKALVHGTQLLLSIRKSLTVAIRIIKKKKKTTNCCFRTQWKGDVERAVSDGRRDSVATTHERCSGAVRSTNRFDGSRPRSRRPATLGWPALSAPRLPRGVRSVTHIRVAELIHTRTDAYTLAGHGGRAHTLIKNAFTAVYSLTHTQIIISVHTGKWGLPTIMQYPVCFYKLTCLMFVVTR